MESTRPVADALSQLVARKWGWVLLRGVFALVFGIVCIAIPVAALGGLVLVFAAYAAIDGVTAIISAVQAASDGRRWIWFLVEGLVNLGAAAVAIFVPGLAIVTLVYVIAFWALLSGATMLIGAFRIDADHGRWWLGLGGVVSLLWGGLLLARPGIGAIVLTTWFGIYALVFGGVLCVLAVRLRNRAQRHLANAA